ncbi:farnesol dehydrogenase-like [Condylostylus longicornis]|uniref:farnesol dehydrogenase-like n=1 Tax=Condylostylus longicornis TaxID=2530218 RepID=UPI00244DACD0|nr:farnesol dehydrogenase-like [Condylostylus longicornis]
MNRWLNKVAVVTGASSGIGVAITKDLLKLNLKVVGLARRQNLIDDIRNEISTDEAERLHSLKCDVSNDLEVQKCFDWIKGNLNGPDILINNAGVLKHGNLINMNYDDIKDTLNINLMGVVNCTRSAFGIMLKKDTNCHIILMNSIAGHRIPFLGKAMPSVNIYGPAKYAIRAANEIFRQEFNNIGSKVKITNISPGLVETPLVPKFILNNSEIPKLKPEDVSNAILYALSTPPHVQINEICLQPVGEIF